jgi:hypothetical protein
MAFKMKGSPMQKGTAAHKKASALKATEDEKATSYSDAYDENLDYKYPSTKPEKEGHYGTDHTKVDKYGREYKGDTTLPNSSGATRSRKKEFETAAKAWNMKTYGTHNPTADAKKAGLTKTELAAKHKASAAKPKKKVEPLKPEVKKKTSVAEVKTGSKSSKTMETIAKGEKPEGATGGRRLDYRNAADRKKMSHREIFKAKQAERRAKRAARKKSTK